MRYLILAVFLTGCTKTILVPCPPPAVPEEPAYCHPAATAPPIEKAGCLAETIGKQRGYIDQLLKTLSGY